MNTPSDTDVLAAKDQVSENAIDRVLVLEMVRVTEAAAVAAAQLIGRGDERPPMPPLWRRCAGRSTRFTWMAPW